MIPPLTGFARHWLADAEISARPGREAACGLSFFFTDAVEYGRFCDFAPLPADAVALAARLRSRFELVPRHWVKLHYQGDQRRGLSQYFVIDPRAVYPISTLRLCLQQCGLVDARGLEPAFEPALRRTDTVWAAIAKRAGARVHPRIACRVPRALLADLFAGAVRQGYVTERLAARYLEQDGGIEAAPYAYLSVDLAVIDACAVDYEDVAPASVPDVCRTLWPEDAAAGERRYLKCRLAPTGAAQWTVYSPLAAVLTAEQLEQLCAPAADGVAYRVRVRRSYDARNATIVREVGSTYQAGLIAPTPAAPPTGALPAAEASNRFLAERAGLAAGLRLLDAGCGTCGPGIDACRAVPGLTIAAVTISARQAATGRQLVRDAGLADRIQVHVADYHALPFAAASFDRVWFLEAFGYAEDPARVCAEIFRVLRRGGLAYIKDVFRHGGALTPAERLELAEFDRVYVQRTPSADDTVAALRGAGFEVEMTDLSGRISMDAFNRAMWRGGIPHQAELTAFGQDHYRGFKRLPVRFVELRATKP